MEVLGINAVTCLFRITNAWGRRLKDFVFPLNSNLLSTQQSISRDCCSLTWMTMQPMQPPWPIKQQLYEARMLNRFSEKILQIVDDHQPLARLTKKKCQKLKYSIHGIKELAPFCFEDDARLVWIHSNLDPRLEGNRTFRYYYLKYT